MSFQYPQQAITVVSKSVTESDTGTTKAVIDVPANTLVTAVWFVVTEAFAGGSPAIDVGDEDNDDGWVDRDDVTEGTIGAYRGTSANGAAYTEGKYYNSADTIDAVVSAGLTNGTGYVVAHMVYMDGLV